MNVLCKRSTASCATARMRQQSGLVRRAISIARRARMLSRRLARKWWAGARHVRQYGNMKVVFRMCGLPWTAKFLNFTKKTFSMDAQISFMKGKINVVGSSLTMMWTWKIFCRLIAPAKGPVVFGDFRWRKRRSCSKRVRSMQTFAESCVRTDCAFWHALFSGRHALRFDISTAWAFRA